MIPLVKTKLPDAEVLMPELQKVLYSGYIAQGEVVDNFEKEFQNFIGNGYSLSLNSGTAALHIALILCGVNEGDEVISTALTAEPTNVAIKMVGAKIRYADVDYETGNISPRSIEENINEKTKAIIVVDYAGIPVNVSEIKSVSVKHDIPVIHDCAHSIGSKFDGVLSGGHFPFTIFSFQAIKQITTIDGGILQILDKSKFEHAKLIRWFGLDKTKPRLENNITVQGYKYHMNNVNASIGLLHMKDIHQTLNGYIENGKYFDCVLKGIPGIEVIKYYENSSPAYWLYTLKVENRTGFIHKLLDKGIAASELHMRNDWHQHLNDFNSNLPNLDLFYSKMVHLPCGWWVTTEQREFIVDVIKSGW